MLASRIRETRKALGRLWRIHSSLLLLGVALGLLELAARAESILDQAAASPQVRSNLIAQHEANPVDFRDDHLLAVGISYIEDDEFKKAQAVWVFDSVSTVATGRFSFAPTGTVD